MVFPVLFFVLLGCFVSWIVIHGLTQLGVGRSGGASPQHHHTHTGVVPRIGGVGMVAGFGLIYILCFYQLELPGVGNYAHYAVFAGGGGAFLLGFVDDLRPLGARIKLLAQVLIALLAYKCGLNIERIGLPFVDLTVELGSLGVFLTVGWFVAMMNLINLIDGLDGLAGGIGLMLMVLLSYLGLEGGFAFSTILALGMVGSILGFLFHNFPPAKVYMGDSGAYLIGYVIAALSLMNSQKGTVLAALVAPVLALALPIADVSFAILRRGLKGLPLFRPDRSHIHHRLLRSGLSHRNTVLVLYGISLAALAAALLIFATQGRYLAILLGFGFVVVLITLRGQKVTVEAVRSMVTDSLRARSDTRNALYLRDWFTVEAERADSGQHLWSDFRFILKKMGFCRAEMVIGEETREFFVPNTPHDDPSALHRIELPIRAAAPATLRLYADMNMFSGRQFHIVADIAAEAWAKAATRWQAINGRPLDFKAVAVEARSYRMQKARNLYRPTY